MIILPCLNGDSKRTEGYSTSLQSSQRTRTCSLGCNCPTKEKNPAEGHCHTYLALGFMQKHYPRLKVEIPSAASSNMYASAQTWNPFKGCNFACTYCGPSFQRQAKRQGRTKSEKPGGCGDCYRYAPHPHEDRLTKIPSKEIVFVCGNADISFRPPDLTRKIIAGVKAHLHKARKRKTFFFQSKKPSYFRQFLAEFPPEAILLTTLETNRDEGYEAISKAPPASVRYEQFRALKYPRKVVTIEPVLDFDLATFVQWIGTFALNTSGWASTASLTP